MGLALGTSLKFYASLSRGSKVIVRKFWGLISTFVEVTGEKLVRRGGGFRVNNPFASCSFVSLQFLLPHTAHFDNNIVLPF